jgi:hypothetical protein
VLYQALLACGTIACVRIALRTLKVEIAAGLAAGPVGADTRPALLDGSELALAAARALGCVCGRRR